MDLFEDKNGESSGAKHRLLLYTETQQEWLFWLNKPAAILSIVASVLVLFVLLRQARERLSKVYGRIWVGICVGNTVVSVLMLLSTVTAPAGTYYASQGTEASCNVSAAILHWFTVYTAIYNGFLGVYYYISVHNRCTDHWLRRNIEPWVHVVAWIWPTLGVILALQYNLYGASDVFMYCWVTPTPFACRQQDDPDCVDGGYDQWWRPLFVWGMGLVELNAFTAPKLVGIFTIYNTLMKQQAKMRQKYHLKSSSSTKRYNTVARETGLQAYWFLAACLIPYFFKILARVVDLFAAPSFWKGPASPAFVTFMMISETLYPIQGFVNAIIFFRPKIRHRQREKEHKDETTWQAFWAILRPQEDKKRPQHRREQAYAMSSNDSQAQEKRQQKELRTEMYGGTIASSVQHPSTVSTTIHHQDTTSCIDEEEFENDGSPQTPEEVKDERHDLEDLEEAQPADREKVRMDSNVNNWDSMNIMLYDGFVVGEDLPDDFSPALHSHRSSTSSGGSEDREENDEEEQPSRRRPSWHTPHHHQEPRRSLRRAPSQPKDQEQRKEEELQPRKPPSPPASALSAIPESLP
mmetsp:Transcript_14536/g.40299  ORF Transcript_14536/g.40299 Transcript_14536/m.40299 type:complete len:578 (+) Transcript_14536:65-1798(+)